MTQLNTSKAKKRSWKKRITSGCRGKKKFGRIIIHFNFSLGSLFWLVKIVTDSVKKRLINARFVDFLTNAGYG